MSHSEGVRGMETPMLDLGLPPPPPPPSLMWPGQSDRKWQGPRLAFDPLPGFSTSLFVHARASEAWDVARLVDHTQVGAVFSVERKRCSHLHQALGAVEHVRRRTLTTNLLVDRNLYSGNKRKSAQDGLSAQWVRDQHTIMQLTWALTDSGFNESVLDVRTTLADAYDMGNGVIVALPMKHQLLRDEARAIVDAINEQPHPVAVMLEHEFDPFDEPGVAGALCYLIVASKPAVLLLRSDTSALGAVSHGARVGAVGTHTGLRHIYPVVEPGGGSREKLAFVIADLLGYYRQRRFEQAYLQAPELPIWRCDCWFCAGRDLTWIGNQPEKLVLRAGFQHSVAAIAELGSRLAAHTADLDSMRAWDLMCESARVQHDQVTNPSGSTWEPKAALFHWQRVARSVRYGSAQ